MTVISKSTIDDRSIAKVLMGLGGTPLILGILSLNWIIILVGILVLTLGILMYFLGKSTYTITYDQNTEVFELKSRQESCNIKKNDVLGVKKKITFSLAWWPFPRPFYYALSARNERGEKSNYRFVIWSNEPNVLRNYGMLRRSVDTWTKRRSS